MPSWIRRNDEAAEAAERVIDRLPGVGTCHQPYSSTSRTGPEDDAGKLVHFEVFVDVALYER